VTAIAERRADVRGIGTRYLEAGRGEPIVFLHGGRAGDSALAESADVWAPALGALSDRYRCIALDRLGQGGTDNPATDEGYAMSAAVAHVVGFLDSFGGEAFHLVGHDHGGYVAAAAALEAPRRVRSCTIVASALCAPGNGRGDFVLAGNPHPPFSAAGARHVLERASFRADHIDPAWLACIERLFAAGEYRAAAARMETAGLYDTVFLPRLRIDRDRMAARLSLGSIAHPTLLVWGFNDPVAPIDMGYGAYDLFARHELRCELQVVNEAGHYPFREKPDAFHRILAGFIENVRHGV
jgi:pimeloyl-ACP methyl ester carboxylesterase